jgi:hypothetical protein
MDVITADESAPVDAYSWLCKATLDIIGLAGVCYDWNIYIGPCLLHRATGFGYKFNALSLDVKHNEFGEAFTTLIRTLMNGGILETLRDRVPALQFIVCESQCTQAFVLHWYLLDSPALKRGRPLYIKRSCIA